MANPNGQQRAKPYRDALRAEIAEAQGSYRDLRCIARAHLKAAAAGKIDAIRELADRLDGKVPNTIATPEGASSGKIVIEWGDDDQGNVSGE